MYTASNCWGNELLNIMKIISAEISFYDLFHMEPFLSNFQIKLDIDNSSNITFCLRVFSNSKQNQFFFDFELIDFQCSFIFIKINPY